MSVLKSLRVKDKEYAFTSFDNDKSSNPARAVFSRFPFNEETFPRANQKNVLNSALLKNFENTEEQRQELVEAIIDNLVSNISANVFDYRNFLRECIDHFEDLEYDGREVRTVSEFLTLPQFAIETIAKELYLYSKTKDEFTMDEKKISE
jgi:hypothetical protein